MYVFMLISEINDNDRQEGRNEEYLLLEDTYSEES